MHLIKERGEKQLSCETAVRGDEAAAEAGKIIIANRKEVAVIGTQQLFGNAGVEEGHDRAHEERGHNRADTDRAAEGKTDCGADNVGNHAAPFIRNFASVVQHEARGVIRRNA